MERLQRLFELDRNSFVIALNYRLTGIRTRREDVYQVYVSIKSRLSPSDIIVEIFKNIDFDMLVKNKKSTEILKAIDMISETFVKQKKIFKYVFIDKSQIAINYLRGMDVKGVNILREFADIDIARKYIASLLCFMRNIGYKSLLLLVDNYDIVLNSRSENMHLSLLRDLYNLSTDMDVSKSTMANLIIVINVSEEIFKKR